MKSEPLSRNSFYIDYIINNMNKTYINFIYFDFLDQVEKEFPFYIWIKIQVKILAI